MVEKEHYFNGIARYERRKTGSQGLIRELSTVLSPGDAQAIHRALIPFHWCSCFALITSLSNGMTGKESWKQDSDTARPKGPRRGRGYRGEGSLRERPRLYRIGWRPVKAEMSRSFETGFLEKIVSVLNLKG